MRHVPAKVCRENQNTHAIFSDVFRKMWKNIVVPGGTDDNV